MASTKLAPFVTQFNYYARTGHVYPTLADGGGNALEANWLEVSFGSHAPDGEMCDDPSNCPRVRLWDRGRAFGEHSAVTGSQGPGSAPRRFGWLCGRMPWDHRATHREGVVFEPVGWSDEGEMSNTSRDAPAAATCENSTWRLDVEDEAYVVTLEMRRLPDSIPGCLLNGHDLTRSWWGTLHGSFQQQVWTVITDGALEISGHIKSCGALHTLSLRKVLIAAGNVECWKGKYQYHTCCLSPDSQAECFPPGLTFESCCRRTMHSKVLSAIPLQRHRPRGCMPPYCQTSCLGPGAEHYRQPPKWVEKVPWPAPMACGDVQVWPLTYGVPRHLVVECLPEKSADFALLHPGDMSTYVFGDDAQEYYRNYRQSIFATTRRKGGADCARHGEILASGAVPYFVGLEQVPNNSMAHHHRPLLNRALQLPGVRQGFVVAELFDQWAWLGVASSLLQWTTHRLTTDAMAGYVLRVLGVPESARADLRVLYIWHNPPMPAYLLHGLREVLQPEHVVDFPRHGAFYEPGPWPAGSQPVADQAVTRSHLAARWSLRRTSVFAEGEAAVLDALARKAFDLAIFARLPEDPSEGHMHRVERAALEQLPRERLVLIDAHDHMPKGLRPWARRVGTTFKYNLGDSCE